MMSGSPVSPESPLVVDGLKSYFITLDGVAKVLTKLSFNLNRSEILGVFGESRSGKTVAARSIVDLLRSPGYVVGGGVYIEGFNIFRDVKRLDKLGAAISSGKEKKKWSSWLEPAGRINAPPKGKNHYTCIRGCVRKPKSHADNRGSVP